MSGSIPAALCRFQDAINPQQGGVNLPCAQSSGASAQSLVALSVSDARAQEAVGAAVAFAVTLSRAASDPVTVGYATRDGSARAGEDYATASGTLTFEAGESSKTVAVAVLDDAHDEGEETFVLALSNVSGARLEDAEATGTIENADLLPAALLARFGRASAQHVVEHVEARMARPREPGFRARFAGRDVRPGMERDFALDFLSQFGRPAGTGPLGGSPMASHASGAGIGSPGMTGQDLRMGGAASLRGPGASSGPGGGFLGAVLPGGDLLSGAEFELNREQHGGVISVWSRSARSQLRRPAGGAVAHRRRAHDDGWGGLHPGPAGEPVCRWPAARGWVGTTAGTSGQVEASATGLYPWLGYKVNDRVSVWGVTGYGAGALRLTPDRAAGGGDRSVDGDGGGGDAGRAGGVARQRRVRAGVHGGCAVGGHVGGRGGQHGGAAVGVGGRGDAGADGHRGFAGLYPRRPDVADAERGGGSASGRR